MSHFDNNCKSFCRHALNIFNSPSAFGRAELLRTEIDRRRFLLHLSYLLLWCYSVLLGVWFHEVWRFFDQLFWQIFFTNFFDDFLDDFFDNFFDKFFWQIFLTDFLTNFLDDFFSKNFLTNVLTKFLTNFDFSEDFFWPIIF